MSLKEHVENTLRISPEPTALFKMILSATTITTPLIIGFVYHQTYVSMFGSLMALIYYFNDPFGPLLKRSKHLFFTFLLLMSSMILGAFCAGNEFLIVFILFILSFAVGKSKDFGLQLERLMLFITLEFLTASSGVVTRSNIQGLLLFSFIAFANYLIISIILYRVTRHEVLAMTSKRESFKKIISHNKSSLFPVVCAMFSCIGYIIAKIFKFSHANWIVGTAIIVMLPDSYMSIYKSAQRVIGTTVGVVVASIVMAYVHDPKMLIVFVFLFSFFMPYGLSKNYWIANIFIAGLIIFFLELAAPQSIIHNHLAYWRIVDITIGSLIGVLAALIIKPEILIGPTKKVGH